MQGQIWEGGGNFAFFSHENLEQFLLITTKHGEVLTKQNMVKCEPTFSIFVGGLWNFKAYGNLETDFELYSAQSYTARKNVAFFSPKNLSFSLTWKALIALSR